MTEKGTQFLINNYLHNKICSLELCELAKSEFFLLGYYCQLDTFTKDVQSSCLMNLRSTLDCCDIIL